MTTQEIANRLVELCNKQDYETCYEELYSPEIVSIEADGTSVQGFEAMAAKGKQWNESIEKWNGAGAGAPIVSGNHFSVPMWMDLQYKGAPAAMKFEEIAVYQVKDGKVVKEQFFYEEPGQ